MKLMKQVTMEAEFIEHRPHTVQAVKGMNEVNVYKYDALHIHIAIATAS